MIGEKHIPKNRIGQSGKDDRDRSDCSFIAVSEYARISQARGWGAGSPRPIARGPNDYTADNQNPASNYAFGSWHSGVCHFLMGDGSVQSLAVTIPAATLESLVRVEDGATVSLP